MKAINYNPQKTIDQIDFDKLIKHPNILIAANFWEQDRFDAAKVCYKFMRKIDDLIDDHKAENKSFLNCEKEAFTEQVNNWINCLYDKTPTDPFVEEVAETITKYRIPLYLFHNFARSMIFDINNSGFSTINAFLNYAEGASVAPASIFVHLACLTKDYSDYLVPNMDLSNIARPCALFSYIVHIIRDFQKDTNENLNYFAEDILHKNQLNAEKLKLIANGGSIPENFRNVIDEYHDYALTYKYQTEEIIKQLSVWLPKRYLLSFEIIYKLYLNIFEKIDIEHGTFTSEELNPSPDELKKLVFEMVNK